MELRWPAKDPEDVKDYRYDVAAWLGDDDTIASITAAVVAGGVVVDSSAEDDTGITVWLSGGTLGSDAALRFRVVTTGGRTHDRTVYMRIRAR